MAATQGIYWFDSAGNNITLEYSADLIASPLAYTFVTDLKALNRNPEASPEVDFTHYGSGEQELKLGLKRTGSFDAVANFAPKAADHAAIIALDASKEERWWRVKYPKAVAASTLGASEKFRGYISTAAISPPGAQDTNPVDFNFSIRVSGDYSFTAES